MTIQDTVKQYGGVLGGAVAGFFLGGPPGALIGAIAGGVAQEGYNRLHPHWTPAPSGVVQPGDYFLIGFSAPEAWTDGDVATFKQSMSALGFQQGAMAKGAPVPPPYAGARGVSLQGKYIGSTPYAPASALPAVITATGSAPTPVAVLVLTPKPGV